MIHLRELTALIIASLLTACTSMPAGPSIMALPGSAKSFDKFRIDDNQCRQLAHEQVNSTNPENFSKQGHQQRYDTSYVQCMYRKDHRVPVYGQFTNDPTLSNKGNLNKSIPPPPSGKPPPPPPE